ncbi:Fic family protein, partial [Alkalihalobacillus hemicellulosilyticus]|uniref:Filamentation induced by cAMP protein Fic n=1 Tax=Halalkalibacter hemicellulosilyticusJCM 9152 TaxID=1236971 RepID=W4QLR4_9BACI
MREHLEAINHREALLLTEDMINNEEIMSERLIKDHHAIILHGIDNRNAGVYRKSIVIISGASHTPPDYMSVPQLMSDLISWYSEENRLHPVEKAAILYSKFVNIHPFIDGNGRTSRLLMNLELVKLGYLSVIIEQEKRFNYYEVLDIAGTNKKYKPFVEFIMDYEVKELKRYVQLIKRNQELDEPGL